MDTKPKSPEKQQKKKRKTPQQVIPNVEEMLGSDSVSRDSRVAIVLFNYFINESSLDVKTEE